MVFSPLSSESLMLKKEKYPEREKGLNIFQLWEDFSLPCLIVGLLLQIESGRWGRNEGGMEREYN